MATPVKSGYSDFGENWKVRKTSCFCFKLIVLMNEQNFESFRSIRSVFSTFQKINQKNQPKKSTNKMATPVRFGYSDFGENWKVRKTSCFCFKLIVLMNRTKFWMFQKHSKGIFNISKNQPKKSTNKMATPVRFGYSDFGQNWKSPQNMLFLPQTDCFDERTKFWMFQKNSKGIFNIWKTQPKKSTNKMATPVWSGYRDFGQNWKVRKTCCFFFKLIVLMKEQNFECFRRIRRVFSTFENSTKKIN